MAKNNQTEKNLGRSLMFSMFMNEDWREKTNEEVVDRSFNKSKAIADTDFNLVIRSPQKNSPIYKRPSNQKGIF